MSDRQNLSSLDVHMQSSENPNIQQQVITHENQKNTSSQLAFKNNLKNIQILEKLRQQKLLMIQACETLAEERENNYLEKSLTANGNVFNRWKETQKGGNKNIGLNKRNQKVVQKWKDHEKIYQQQVAADRENRVQVREQYKIDFVQLASKLLNGNQGNQQSQNQNDLSVKQNQISTRATRGKNNNGSGMKSGGNHEQPINDSNAAIVHPSQPQIKKNNSIMSNTNQIAQKSLQQQNNMQLVQSKANLQNNIGNQSTNSQPSAQNFQNNQSTSNINIQQLSVQTNNIQQQNSLRKSARLKVISKNTTRENAGNSLPQQNKINSNLNSPSKGAGSSSGLISTKNKDSIAAIDKNSANQSQQSPKSIQKKNENENFAYPLPPTQIQSQNINYQKKLEEKFESSSKIQTPLKMKMNSVQQMEIDETKFFNQDEDSQMKNIYNVQENSFNEQIQDLNEKEFSQNLNARDKNFEIKKPIDVDSFLDDDQNRQYQFENSEQSHQLNQKKSDLNSSIQMIDENEVEKKFIIKNIKNVSIEEKNDNEIILEMQFKKEEIKH